MAHATRRDARDVLLPPQTQKFLRRLRVRGGTREQHQQRGKHHNRLCDETAISGRKTE